MIATTYPRWSNDTEPAFVFELSKRLLALGNDITVLAPHAPGALKEEYMEGLRVLRYQYFIPGKFQRLFYNGGAIPNLKKYYLARVQLPFFLLVQPAAIFTAAIRGKYDLIHCHWIVPQGFFAALASRFMGIPLILTAHGGDVFNLKNAFVKSIARFSVKNSSICTANSGETKKGIQSFCPGKEVDIIPMGVDLNLFNKDKKDDSIKQRFGIRGHFLLGVGRFAEKKGFCYLIDAMPGVLREFPETRLLIIGFGPLEGELKSQVRKLGLEKSVCFPGKMTSRELAGFYATADMFIGPSVETEAGDREGLGVVFLEAMACGTAVIGSKSGGIEDIIKDGETGLLSTPKDPSEISSKILHLLKDEPFRERMAEKGREFVEKNFSWDSIGEKFSSLYLKLIKEP